MHVAHVDSQPNRFTPAAHDLPVSTLLGALHDGIVVMGAEGVITACNASAEHILGLTADQLAGRTTHDPRWQAIREDGSPFPGDAHPVSVSLRTGQPVQNVVMGVCQPSGELTWISINSRALFHPGKQNPYAVVASFTDISDLKRSEAALRQSEESFRLLFENNPLPMWVYDLDTLRFLAVNDSACTHYGYSQPEFLAMTIADIRPIEHLAAPRVSVAVTLPAQQSGLWTHRKKDGTRMEVEVSSQPVPFVGHRARLVLARDVTEHRRLETQVRQLQKMEGIGRLAGGIAHDFNNVLGVILGYGDRLLRRLPEDERKEIREVMKAAEHAATLTRQLLSFSRKQVLEPRILDPNVVVQEIEGMLRRIIGEDIHLVTALRQRGGAIKADPGQLHQVIMNLAINARDAMPNGGTLTIETADTELDESYAAEHIEVCPGPYVMLAVNDTGIGMDRETQSRIFEPFFTTKEAGKGTGLGLATVYGIVKQSGGHLWVYSELGHGTTFKVYLPRVANAAEAAQAPTASNPLPKGTETILLVEDDESLRDLAREILEEQGYAVLKASTGKMALELAEEHAGPIHLVMTDLVMPGMSGRELAERVMRRRLESRVLFMSGYTDDALERQGILEGNAAFVGKPFTLDGLLRKVREVLDS
jgi:PAS domain S-box-containing protein